MSFADLIYEIRQKGNDGKDFEVFCKWFLLNDPYWKTQVDEVWLWDDWPQRWDRDKGIDLVFRHKNGEMWAVQSKCYAETTRITKEDVDSFLSDSNRKIISKRLLMASTNSLGRNAFETMAGQEKPVVRWMLDDFENSAILYPQALSELNKSAETKEHEDRPYQLEAVEAVVEGLNSHNRGQLIMACGTGKTFVTLWIKERLKPQTCLVLLPSLSLLSQTLHEWTANCKDEFEVLCVCSDATVGKRNTNEDLRISEAPFDVISDPDVIRTFLKQSRPKVIFCTYQSSELIGKAQGNAVIDLVVCDEAHRCAGPATSSFTKVLDNKFIKAKKRLFTTATPRVFSKATVKSADARGYEIYGMDDETAFGPILHTYSFGQAIEDKWLTDYQVLIVGVDEPTIQSYIETREIVGSTEAGIVSDAETLAAKLSLLKATAEYDLKRVISFHGRVKAAKEFSSEYCDLIDLVEPSKRPDGVIWTDYVSGEMSAGDRKQKIQKLKKLSLNERGLLANARCLSEGVDVPSLDGVAFIDPKGSQIDIIQAVGRALRKSDEKKFGTIILPVFIEPGDNEIERIESSNFKPVWDVLKALRSHDERLGESIDGIRTELGKRHKSRKTLPDNIIFDLPISVGIEFSASLQTRLIESVSESWYFWYGLLQEYAEKCGNSAPPLKYLTENGWKLGVWVNAQRNKKERLSPEQCERLDDLGFIWNMLDEKWEQGFSALLKFYKRQGHCVVPISHKEDDYSLGNWVGAQRQNKDELSPERSQRLDDLGFVWDMLDHHFEEGFSSLEKFYQREGHCLVPRGPTKEIKKLARWVQNQREKSEILTPLQRERLDSIGFIWDVLEHQFEKGFLALESFKKREGHCLVPQHHKEIGVNLGVWVSGIRVRKDKQDAERLQRLENLGFIWDALEHQFEQGFEALKSFHEREGHCMVPRWHKEKNYNLGNWIIRLRARKQQIEPENIKRLDDIGFLWDPRAFKFEQGLAALKTFYEREGHCMVPGRHKENGYRLGAWVTKLRPKRDTLSIESLSYLNEIGFVWNVPEYQFEQGFSALKTFYEREGHCLVPQRYEESGVNLGSWVSERRVNKDKLTVEKRKLLDSLGFVWDVRSSQFETGFSALQAFYEREGHCRVPYNNHTENGINLSNWVKVRRKSKDDMKSEWRQRLDEIGFVWTLSE